MIPLNGTFTISNPSLPFTCITNSQQMSVNLQYHDLWELHTLLDYKYHFSFFEWLFVYQLGTVWQLLSSMDTQRSFSVLWNVSFWRWRIFFLFLLEVLQNQISNRGATKKYSRDYFSCVVHYIQYWQKKWNTKILFINLRMVDMLISQWFYSNKYTWFCKKKKRNANYLGHLE